MKPFYEHAGVTIYCGDCLAVLPELPRADLICTDPPYNVSARGVGGRANTTIGRVPRKDGTMREIQRDYGEWDHDWRPEPFVALAAEAIREGGTLVSFASEFTMPPFLESGGLLFWRKTNPAPSFRKQIVRAIEMAVWQTRGGKWTFNAGGYCPNVWDVPIINGYTCQNTSEQRWHPTQKPEALISQWLALFSNSNDLVLDPFMGSGTTITCAKRLGRRAIGIDVDERYCEIAAKRLQQEALPLVG